VNWSGGSELSATYYLDESGNTGDAIRAGDKLDFGAQPMFTLAGIGIDDLTALATELTRLKAVHRLRGAELKSSSIRNKPLFLADLIGYLKQQGAPVFIEVVDKKFFICAHLVNTLFLPAIGNIDFTPEDQFLCNTIAEYLAAYMPETILRSVVIACDQPSRESLTRIFDALAEWLGSKPFNDQVAAGALRFLDDTRAEFKEQDPNEDFTRFLPIPDKGKRDQTYWMLPNLSSFTNIYARINLYHNGNLSGVKLVHDEQSHFDAILIKAKETAERLAASNDVIKVSYADYHFRQKATLSFEKSTSNVGLQVADCLAGFVMRHVLDGLGNGRPIDRAGAIAFRLLLSMTNAKRGSGVNFVLTSSDMRRLGILF
jgi:Protein of unknown function (DUF3800)